MVEQLIAVLLMGLFWLAKVIQPWLVPLCFGLAWLLVIAAAWSIWAAIRDGMMRARQMHQIPCADCKFFTHNYHLKCPVHPMNALSEAAINCPDFESAGIYFNSDQPIVH